MAFFLHLGGEMAWVRIPLKERWDQVVNMMLDKMIHSCRASFEYRMDVYSENA